jgi:predicted RNA-binding protein with PUA-like domain
LARNILPGEWGIGSLTPMRYWLMKTEPGTYSIDDLARDKSTRWDGVRNPIARKHMQDMKEGDLVLFYHSSAEPPGVAGIAKVSREAYADPTQFDAKSDYYDQKATKEKPRWFLVDITFVEKLKSLVSLADIKADAAFSEMVLVKNSRLSVQPVTADEFKRIKAMAK